MNWLYEIIMTKEYDDQRSNTCCMQQQASDQAAAGNNNARSAGATATATTTSTSCCCPVFDTTRYDEKVHVTWNDKPFLQESVWSFFYIPLTFGRATRRALTKIEKANAQVDHDKDYLLLDDFSSPWGSNIYLAVSKNVPNAKMTTISGIFITKTFEGPYHKCGEWIQDTIAFVRKETGKDPLKIYAHYTTCPKCAKAHGKNYVVMFAQIA